jgi:hypothetical protein
MHKIFSPAPAAFLTLCAHAFPYPLKDFLDLFRGKRLPLFFQPKERAGELPQRMRKFLNLFYIWAVVQRLSIIHTVISLSVMILVM